jgi:hypothetical protein
MIFTTPVVCREMPFKISHADSCVFTGSCFAENIGRKMEDSKIITLVNPTGIHYNPISVAETINSALSGKEIRNSDLFFANGRWNHFCFHSELSGKNQQEAFQKMTEALKTLKDSLSKASVLFITFGTSVIYEHNETGEIVSNCHKLPTDTFRQRFVMPDEIINVWNKLLSDIRVINPKLKVVFTVSPIRHFKNGATENQFSKSSLFIAIKSLVDNNNTFYFPAYEIMNDELRDYRFYANDMLHPSEVGIGYIWEKFSEIFFTPTTIELNRKIEKIIKASRHKVFDNTTEEYRKFCSTILNEIAKLEKEIPGVDFSKEKMVFE